MKRRSASAYYATSIFCHRQPLFAETVPQGFHIQFMLEAMQDLVADDSLVSQPDYRLAFRREGLVAQAPERLGMKPRLG